MPEPTQSGQPAQQVASQPVMIVIFGITGDLAQRKLLPALYHLLKDGLLHPESVILGITRRSVTAAELLGQVELCVNEIDKVCDPAGLRLVHDALRMHQMTLTDGVEYDELLTMLNDIETEKGICMNRLYYLSIPPQMTEPIVRNLGQHGHTDSCQHAGSAGAAETRLLVEKPFGYDSASAQALIDETAQWFNENQLFRIDHYVAKDTVQDILAVRASQPELEAVWNAEHIASIEVTAWEELTIEGRAVFYEGVGALRDFVQNHLLQLLTIATMDLPANQDSDTIHAAKLQLLQAIEPILPAQVAQQAVRGQYQGYRDEVANQHSATETYAALTLHAQSPRWQGVPLTIRTGKAMARKLTEIRVVFKPAGGADGAGHKDVVFTIHSTTPGQPDAYEKVLLDAASGDHTLFTTSAEVMVSWRIVENVLHAWNHSDDGLIIYPIGSETVTK